MVVYYASESVQSLGVVGWGFGDAPVAPAGLCRAIKYGRVDGLRNTSISAVSFIVKKGPFLTAVAPCRRHVVSLKRSIAPLLGVLVGLPVFVLFHLLARINTSMARILRTVTCVLPGQHRLLARVSLDRLCA